MLKRESAVYIGLCILCECVHKICIANENLYAAEREYKLAAAGKRGGGVEGWRGGGAA